MAPRRAPRTKTTLATSTATTPMTDAAIRALISRGVADALAEHEIQRNNNLNGDGSQGSRSGIARPVRPTRECTYTDFLKCQPMNFKGTEGVVGLTQWFERIETVFNISNCAVENQVKFATCTLYGVALTCTAPRNEIKKLEIEIWELKVKGTDLASYTQRFQELALLCERMFSEEFDMIEKYVGGLPEMIHRSVMASKPKTMQDAVEFATELMDKKIHTFAERQTENKRKFEDTASEKNKVWWISAKNVPSATTIIMVHVHRSATSATRLATWPVIAGVLAMLTLVTIREPRANQRGNGCYECGAQGHFKRECPKLKNNNCGNQGGDGNALAKVMYVGNCGDKPGLKCLTGTVIPIRAISLAIRFKLLWDNMFAT
ncbi:putative reverse transcriptase domain-containing protein [Tanacetum coccineum]